MNKPWIAEMIAATGLAFGMTRMRLISGWMFPLSRKVRKVRMEI